MFSSKNLLYLPLNLFPSRGHLQLGYEVTGPVEHCPRSFHVRKTTALIQGQLTSLSPLLLKVEVLS